MYKIFKHIWARLSKRRKIQALFIIGITVLASLAEILTLSSFVIMLNYIMNPGKNVLLPFHNLDIIKLIYDSLNTNPTLIFSTFIICVVATGSLRLLLLWSTLRYSFITGSDFAKIIFFNTLAQPLEYHLKTSSNEILNSLTKKVHLICFEVLLPLLIVNSHIFIIICITSFILFIMGVIKTLIMIILISLLYFIVWKYSKQTIDKNSFLISKDTDNLVTLIQESFSVIRLILLKGIQNKFSEEFDTINRNIKIAEGTNFFLAQGTRILIETVFLVLIVIAIIFTLESQNIDSILPLIGAFGLGSLRILPLAQRAYQGYTTIRGARYSFYDLLEYLNLTTNSQAVNLNFKKIKLTKFIKLKNITYSYPGAKYKVLDKISLKFPVNKLTVIKGATGSGKSTLISIIMGLIKPSEGSVIADDLVINDKNIKNWQNIISYMPQETIILNASLERNLNFFENKKIKTHNLKKVLNLSNLENFISTFLNNPFKTLGERGSNISGGEKQRVGLSRTIIEGNPILILDEPSSALDKKTTNIIFSNLKKNYQNITIIAITHDSEVLKFADKVITLSTNTN